MATPPVLRAREPSPVPLTARLDGVSAITVLVLAAVLVGLIVAGVLAVYDYSTPEGEAPLVQALAIAFGLALGLNVLAAAIRQLLRLRRR